MTFLVKLTCALICLLSIGLIAFSYHQSKNRAPGAPESDPIPVLAFPAQHRMAGQAFLVGEMAPARPEAVDTNFDFTADIVSPPIGPDDPRPRSAGVVFHYRDEQNYAFARLEKDKSLLGRVEGGAEIVLARGTLGIEANRAHKLMVRRRGSLVTLAIDGKLSAAAYDDTLSGGEVRPAGAQVQFTHLQLLPIRDADVAWADDFMRANEDLGSWESSDKGHWRVLTMTNPSRSANAFSFNGMGRSTMAIAGQATWDRYAMGVSLRGPAGGRLGIGFSMLDARNGFLFRWSSIPKAESGAAKAGSNGDAPKHEIVKLTDGREDVLASLPGGYWPGQWYRITVLLDVGRARVEIDGLPVMEARDPAMLGGRIGLWADADNADLVYQMSTAQANREPVAGRVHAFTPSGAEVVLPGPRESRITIPRNDVTSIAYGGVTFDDVTVTNLPCLRDDFAAREFLLGGWTPLTGTWVAEQRVREGTEASGKSTVCGARLGGDGEGRVLFGTRSWEDYRFGADVSAPAGATVGLLFNYRDESNYDAVSVSERNVGLVRVRNGQPQPWGGTESSIAFPARIEIATDRGHVQARIQGRTILEAYDPVPRSGRVGFFASRAPGALFSNAEVRFHDAPPMVLSANAVFDDERTMKAWAGNVSDWRQGGLPVKGAPVYWHRAICFGDTEIVVEVEEQLPAKLAGNVVEAVHRRLFGERIELTEDERTRLRSELSVEETKLRQAYARRENEVALSIAKTEDVKRRNNGYVLEVKIPPRKAYLPEIPAAPPSGASTSAPSNGGSYGLDFRLLNDGEPVKLVSMEGVPAEHLLAEMPESLHSLGLRQAGTFVVAYLNGECVGYYRGTEPKKGGRVAYYARGVKVDQPHVCVYNRRLINYTFSGSPTDWRVGNGAWEVASRWQCDPRWSFLSGFYKSWPRLLTDADSQEAKLASIWNKLPLEGDFSIECFVGPKMQREAGNRYEYVRDFNISVCADGKDLTSGYLFSWGTAGNTKSAIYRAGRLVTQSNHTIPRDIHRQWFALKVIRHGNQFRFYVDDAPILEYEDPQPLAGRFFSIWTYRMGLMVSRARVSAETIGRPPEPWTIDTGPSGFTIEGETQAAYR